MIINAFANQIKTSCLDSALDYASRGFKVLPTHGLINGICSCGGRANCKPGKHPACQHGVKDAITDATAIRSWWDSAYWLNCAIATGGEHFVFEVDPRHGGDKTLASLIAEHDDLPLTPTVKSGGGGLHYYFKYPKGVVIPSRSGVAEGIDVRGDNGYVLAPPSNHISGNEYEWVVGLDTPIASAPDWVLALVVKGSSGAKAKSPSGGFTFTMRDAEPDDFASHPGAKEGNRNDEFMRLLGVHINRGDNPKTIKAMANAWADRCWPPIPPGDVERRLRWGESKRRDSVGGLGEEDHDAFISAFSDGMERNETPTLARAQAGFHSIPFHPADAQAKVESHDLQTETPNTIPHDADDEDVGETDALDDAIAEPGADAWPTLHADAYHGLAGAIVRAIAPETEADPAGVLLTLLTAFGNAVGSRAHYAMNAGVHHANLFAALVGDTASGKGQALSAVLPLIADADPEWHNNAVAYGLSSGEGLVDRVKDEVTPGKDGAFRMPSSKRLLCVETEFVKPIVAMRREGNTLSAMLRAAWDHQKLEVNTRGKSKLTASNAHVGIVAHITPEELVKALGGSVEVANGFANRFLWALVKRANLLPDGGDPDAYKPFVEPLRSALDFARDAGRVHRDDDAGALWASVYEGLTEARPGPAGSATARARAQVLRLSLLYALLDKSNIIRAGHLRAALAVWRFCEASATLIFNAGEGPVSAANATANNASEPEALDMRLLNAIVREPGIKRSALNQSVASSKRGLVGEALGSLESRDLAHRGRCRPEHGGRPAECWWPGSPDDDDDDAGFTLTMGNGEGEEDDLLADADAKCTPGVHLADASPADLAKYTDHEIAIINADPLCNNMKRLLDAEIERTRYRANAEGKVVPEYFAKYTDKQIAMLEVNPNVIKTKRLLDEETERERSRTQYRPHADEIVVDVAELVSSFANAEGEVKSPDLHPTNTIQQHEGEDEAERCRQALAMGKPCNDAEFKALLKANAKTNAMPIFALLRANADDRGGSQTK